MNSWFKLALYAFIGIIIGSFALGIIAPGYNNGMNTVPGQMQMNGINMGPGQTPMGGMQGQGGMGMMSGGMM